ncbi:MAG: CoA pyrophosphatase [Gammaproteobacteria bacterium TMED1]|nr:MAG: CoA pyrophosphatase [Gammaproteobacteria bacterium TMED1]
MAPKKLSLREIKNALAQHTPQRPTSHALARQAAVAIIIRSNNDFMEALFILRSVRKGDPWSGDMAFPGGHKNNVDLSLRETAERETFEEIGLTLSHSSCFLGELDTIELNRRQSEAILITPFVYSLRDKDCVLHKNHEVAEILWGPLDHMIIGTSLVNKEVKRNGTLQYFPGYTLDKQIIWGLTFRMLQQLFSLISSHVRLR